MIRNNTAITELNVFNEKRTFKLMVEQMQSEQPRPDQLAQFVEEHSAIVELNLNNFKFLVGSTVNFIRNLNLLKMFRFRLSDTINNNSTIYVMKSKRSIILVVRHEMVLK